MSSHKVSPPPSARPSHACRILSWNVNSVRRRLGHIERVIKQLKPDVLCLQETKVRDSEFPSLEFSTLGYEHQAIRGMPAYNGVAILSAVPFQVLPKKVWRGREDKRHIAVKLSAGGVELHCFYVPSGGGVPDPERNEKFADKLRFVEALTRWSRTLKATPPRLLVGDFNIALLEHDVWNHAQARRSVGHTERECVAFARFIEAGGWCDLQRREVPPTEPFYTWWSYRHPLAHKQKRGWRLDYAFANQACLARVLETSLYSRARGWQSPSDHAPVIVDLSLPK